MTTSTTRTPAPGWPSPATATPFWEGRWPGPHRRDEIIGSADGGCFVLDYLYTAASGEPVAVYRWVADRENP